MRELLFFRAAAIVQHKRSGDIDDAENDQRDRCGVIPLSLQNDTQHVADESEDKENKPTFHGVKTLGMFGQKAIDGRGFGHGGGRAGFGDG